MRRPSDQPLFETEFLSRLARLGRLVSRVRASGSSGTAARRGRGGLVEIAGHRRYVPGDDLRSIDWSAYARLEKLFVKEFDKQEHVPVVLLLDTSASMSLGDPTKRDFALRLAAALTFLALAGENPTRVAAVGESGWRPIRELHRLPEFPGILGDFKKLEFSGRADLPSAVQSLVESRIPRSLVILITDFLGEEEVQREVAEGLIGARARGHDVALLQVLSRQEIDPGAELDPGDRLTVFDVETAGSLGIPPGSDWSARYRVHLEEFLSNWRKVAARHGMRYLLATSDSGLEDTVLDFLRAGGFLR